MPMNDDRLREWRHRHRHVLYALRWFAVLAIPATLAVLFVWCAGWFSPRLSPARIVDAFQATTTPHPGFRRNHAKGVCVTGHFVSDGAGTQLSRASVFAHGQYPVVGRLSIPGSDPGQSDGAAQVRSFALRVLLPHGEEWRLAMNSVPVFAVRTPRALFEQLEADARDPGTGRANPAKMQAFLDSHPEVRAFGRYLDRHPPSSGYDNATYYGISAFETVNGEGVHRFVRWEVVPENLYRPADAGRLRDPDFLAYDLMKHLRSGPLRWHLMLNVALPGDTTDDSTRQWAQSPDRMRIDVGTLVIDRAQAQIDGSCRDIIFDPTILPNGIAPSSDLLLAARSATYAESFVRRMKEESATHAGTH